MDELDDLLEQVRRRPSHPALDGVESSVLAAIAATRRHGSGPATGLIASVAAVPLGIGLLLGSLAPPPPPQRPVLQAALQFAPSSRLGARL